MPKKTQIKKSNSFLSQIKWGESYTSLVLGAIVVVIGLILLFSFFKTGSLKNQEIGSASTKNETSVLPSSYTVKKGDDLWKISQNLYGSGYNWVDIAKANKLKNPGLLYVGTKLSIPTVNKDLKDIKLVKQGSISGATYKVVKGDCLWDIAVRAYGDGFKWTEIAKVNNLVNPNIIHAGNIFKLPR